jgi:multidrug resistance protein, MATE family
MSLPSSDPTSDSTATPQEAARRRLLEVSVGAQVLWLALPALGEQALNYSVGLFDTWLAGQIPPIDGETGAATSAVGLASYVTWLATLIFGLVGTGTTALVARAIGAGDVQAARRITNVSLGLGALLGIGVSAGLYLLAPTFASLQDLTGESRRIAVDFLQVEALGEFFYVFCLIGCAALRGAGDMRSPMLLLGLVNILNMIVSPALVFGWFGLEPWGIEGVVAGTFVARVAIGLLTLLALFRGAGGLALTTDLFRPFHAESVRILRVGLPAVIDGLLMWTGHFLFLMIISRVTGGASPSANRAAHMIGVQVEGLTYLAASAWGYAAAALIGRFIGAGLHEHAIRAGHLAARHVAGVALFGSIFYFLGSEAIYAAMTTEPEVREVGTRAMRVLAVYQIPLTMMIVYIFCMRGAGDTRAPALINTAGIFLVRLPLGYLFGVVWNGGLIGAWIGMSCDVALRWLCAWWYFSRGHSVRTEV